MERSIVKVLMKRDGLSLKDAEHKVKRASDDLRRRRALADDEMSFDICEEWFGLEPDYVDELI